MDFKQLQSRARQDFVLLTPVVISTNINLNHVMVCYPSSLLFLVLVSFRALYEGLYIDNCNLTLELFLMRDLSWRLGWV